MADPDIIRNLSNGRGFRLRPREVSQNVNRNRAVVFHLGAILRRVTTRSTQRVTHRAHHAGGTAGNPRGERKGRLPQFLRLDHPGWLCVKVRPSCPRLCAGDGGRIAQ